MSAPLVIRNLAPIAPKTLALMHGASYRGDGEKAIGELRGAVKEFYGKE